MKETVRRIIIIIIIIIQTEKFAPLRFPRSLPLVLLVKVRWTGGGAKGKEEGRVLGSGLLAAVDTVSFY
jgi:hypothetical protein